MDVPFKVELEGRTVLLTGGGGVLCGCMARALGACGANVVVADLRAEGARAVAEEITATGGQALAVGCNVLERDSLEEARAAVAERFGAVDILINGAGGNHPKGTTAREYLRPEDLDAPPEDGTTFYDLAFDGVQFVFNLNFLGTLLPCQVFTREMAARGRGTVINISSMSALAPLTKVPAYSAAKAAISNFTQWLAVHLSKVGIRVNALAPGFFLTEQNRRLLTQQDGSLTARGETILSQTPMGRFGSPEDLLGALLWLVCDPGAGFVTGTVIPIDGGFSAFSGV